MMSDSVLITDLRPDTLSYIKKYTAEFNQLWIAIKIHKPIKVKDTGVRFMLL